MASEWREALRVLHARGWSGELVANACETLHVERAEGALQGKEVADLGVDDVVAALSEPVDDEETEALLVLSEVYECVDDDNDSLRAALIDLDAFVDAPDADD